MTASGHVTAHPTCSNPSGDMVDGQGGAAGASTSPTVPSQQDGAATNERSNKRSRATPPNREGGGARETAAPPESITMAAGDGDRPQSREGGPAAGAGSAVPEGQSKETHELHNKGEAVFISFDMRRPASRLASSRSLLRCSGST